MVGTSAKKGRAMLVALFVSNQLIVLRTLPNRTVFHVIPSIVRTEEWSIHWTVLKVACVLVVLLMQTHVHQEHIVWTE